MSFTTTISGTALSFTGPNLDIAQPLCIIKRMQLRDYSEMEIQRLWELYLVDCGNKDIKPGLSDYVVWLSEEGYVYEEDS